MKRFRVLFLALALGLVTVTCSNPTAPRVPEDDEKPDPNDPDPRQGFLITQEAEITFLV